jgi:hypothetical protein
LPTSQFLTPTPTPTTDPTTDWKTYTNANFGLQFKYPAHYSLSFDSNAFLDGDLLSISAPAPPHEPSKVDVYDIFLLTIAKPQITDLSLDDWLKSSPYTHSYLEEKPVQFSHNTRLGGQRTAQSSVCGEGCYTYLFAKYRGSIFGITFPATLDRYKAIFPATQLTELQNNLDQILSTFKFLE